MSKATKKETDYSLGMIHSHCGKVFDDDKGYCEHYQDNRTCNKVQGNINPVYWCKLWEKAKQ